MPNFKKFDAYVAQKIDTEGPVRGAAILALEAAGGVACVVGGGMLYNVFHEDVERGAHYVADQSRRVARNVAERLGLVRAEMSHD